MSQENPDHLARNVTVFLLIATPILFLGVWTIGDSLFLGTYTKTTTTSGTVTYFSVADGAATIIINTRSVNQTTICPLVITHQKTSGSITWPWNVPLMQASDPS